MVTKFSMSELNLQDALDLAILVEVEAQERYEEFSRQIGASKEDDAGSFFVLMAKNEAKHAQDISLRRKKLFPNSPSRMSPEILFEFQEIEAPEFDKVRSFMSVQSALKLALECEVKAFNFYEKALTLVKDTEVKNLFKELRDEEVEHQKMVKDIIKKRSGSTNPEVDQNDIDEPAGL
jgi:rubrerythrin